MLLIIGALAVQIEWLRKNPAHGPEPHQSLLAVSVLSALFQAQGVHPIHYTDLLASLDGACSTVGP
jgi:hypothetical protein